MRCGNAAARALYAAAGFKEDGIRQRFYENPVEDAVLMSRELKSTHNSGSSFHYQSKCRFDIL